MFLSNFLKEDKIFLQLALAVVWRTNAKIRHIAKIRISLTIVAKKVRISLIVIIVISTTVVR